MCIRDSTRLGGYADYTSSEEPDPKSQEILDVLARGVPQDHLTISSDSNGSMPKWGPNKELIGITYAKMTSLFGQIQSLVKKGLPLEQALCFVTQNVAQAAVDVGGLLFHTRVLLSLFCQYTTKL